MTWRLQHRFGGLTDGDGDGDGAASGDTAGRVKRDRFVNDCCCLNLTATGNGKLGKSKGTRPELKSRRRGGCLPTCPSRMSYRGLREPFSCSCFFFFFSAPGTGAAQRDSGGFWPLE